MRHKLVALLLVVLASTGLTALPTATAAQPRIPFPLPTAPEGDIRGVNEYECKPTTERPTPVILVHGTIGDRRHLLGRIAKAMMANGFCVFSLDYGNRGLEDIPTSAGQLKTFTEKVLTATGAAKVSFVGHSQGGMMPRYYIKFLGGAPYVDDLVGIAPSNHGTALTGGANPLAALVGFACVACVQQGAGSPFLMKLNAGDETPGKVSYTNITSRYDEIVVPHTSGYLKGSRTTNVTIQDKCPFAIAEHLLIPMAASTISLTLNALTRPGPAQNSFQPACF